MNSDTSYLINLSKDKNENEKEFQEAWNNKDWNKIWMCTHICCLNIIKSWYKKHNVIIPDDELLEKVTDSVAYCMKFFRKGVRPEKLSSYTYLRCLRHIIDKKEIEKVKNETYFLYDASGKQLEIGEHYDTYFDEEGDDE